MDLRDNPARIGAPSARSSPRRRRSSRLCSTVLPKPKPGSMTMRWRGMPAADTGLDPLLQEITHLAGHIGVDRMVLHAARLALHVHETHRYLQRRRGFDRARFAQRTHVIDESGAGRDRGTHDFRLGGIDGDRHRHGACNRFDDRNHPVELFLHGNRLRPRTGGFAADIDDVRALLDHRECVRHGRIAHQKNTPVREGVGGNVQDPHDGRAREIKRATTAVERRHYKKSAADERRYTRITAAISYLRLSAFISSQKY